MSQVFDLVIYTVLTGTKEDLGDPLRRATQATDLKIDFVCLTDIPGLNSSTWRVMPFNTLCLPVDKASRMPKALPHAFFAKYARYSLYIDNTVEFRRLPNSDDLRTQQPYLFKLYEHHGRRTIIEEAAAIASLGYDSASNLIRQLEHYSQYTSLKDITPLSTCTIMFRDHTHPQLVKHGEFWWAQILNFGPRDQMSFDFSLNQTGTKVEYLKGNKHNNDLVFPQDNYSSSRVRAHFDSKRYAWLHRTDPCAVQNPKRHFLKNSAVDESKTQFIRRDTDPLDLYFYLFGCSFGSSHSPRRNLARLLERFFRLNFQGSVKTVLRPFFLDKAPTEFSISRPDFEALCLALGNYVRGEILPLTLCNNEGNVTIPDSLPTPSNVQSLFLVSNLAGFAEFQGVFEQIVGEDAPPRSSGIFIFNRNLEFAEEFAIRNVLQCSPRWGSYRSTFLSSDHDSVDDILDNQIFVFTPLSLW